MGQGYQKAKPKLRKGKTIVHDQDSSCIVITTVGSFIQPLLGSIYCEHYFSYEDYSNEEKHETGRNSHSLGSFHWLGKERK